MDTRIKDKLGEIFAEAVMLGHPGGVITEARPGSFFLPEPDHRSSVQLMGFVNDRLQEHDLREIAAAAFAMVRGDPSIMEGVFHCTSTARSGKFMGATITLRWHDGPSNKDWSALKFTILPPPLID